MPFRKMNDLGENNLRSPKKLERDDLAEAEAVPVEETSKPHATFDATGCRWDLRPDRWAGVNCDRRLRKRPSPEELKAINDVARAKPRPLSFVERMNARKKV